MKDLQHCSIPRENDYLRLCDVCSYGVTHCDTYKIQIKTGSCHVSGLCIRVHGFG